MFNNRAGMCRLSVRAGLAVLVFTSVGALAQNETAPQSTAADGRAWLDRMNVAVEQLNYRGKFVDGGDGQMEVLEIVHRNAGGVVSEKISALDGGREIIRTPKQLRTVLPDRQLVVLEEPRESSTPFGPPLTNVGDELEAYYELATWPSTRGKIADRSAQVVIIRSKDEYRYSYYFWLDQETALPLRSQVVSHDDEIVEQIVFTEIEVLDSIDEAEVAPVIDTEGFKVQRPIRPTAAEPVGGEEWEADLPSGFHESVDGHVLLAGSEYPVRHLVYTDGLATVSVFISHPKSKADMEEGFRSLGSTNYYSLKIDGRLATAMGEVPPRTVQRIATTLNAR